MTIDFVERPSPSPYIETVTAGRTLCAAAVIRPAESRWHLVVVRTAGQTRTLVVGPWTSAGIASYGAGAEILWLRFRLGTFMPRLPTRRFVNSELLLAAAAPRTFRLDGATWDAPDADGAELWVERLARAGVLDRDPLVAAPADPPELAERTLRHRFLHAAGVSRSHVRQLERAQQARALLLRGVPIADAMFEAGYYDQPHLTRALKHYLGYTPAQLRQQRLPE